MSDPLSVRPTRRVLIGAGVLIAGAAASNAIAAKAEPKLAQTAVAYRDKPAGKFKCDLCTQWQAPNACKIVAGTISPNGWCNKFVLKT